MQGSRGQLAQLLSLTKMLALLPLLQRHLHVGIPHAYFDNVFWSYIMMLSTSLKNGLKIYADINKWLIWCLGACDMAAMLGVILEAHPPQLAMVGLHKLCSNRQMTCCGPSNGFWSDKLIWHASLHRRLYGERHAQNMQKSGEANAAWAYHRPRHESIWYECPCLRSCSCMGTLKWAASLSLWCGMNSWLH